MTKKPSCYIFTLAFIAIYGVTFIGYAKLSHAEAADEKNSMRDVQQEMQDGSCSQWGYKKPQPIDSILFYRFYIHVWSTTTQDFLQMLGAYTRPHQVQE